MIHFVRIAAIALSVLLLGCASVPATPPEPETSSGPDVEALLSRAREVPLTREAVPGCLSAWRAVLDRTSKPAYRVEVLYCIACAHNREDRPGLKQAALEEAVMIPTVSRFRTLSLYPLAEGRHRLGDAAGALAAIESFLIAAPVNRSWTAAAGYLRGKWLAAQGEAERAVTALRFFLEANESAVDLYNHAAVTAARDLLGSLTRDS